MRCPVVSVSIGTAGGDVLMQVMAQFLLEVLIFGVYPREAVQAPPNRAGSGMRSGGEPSGDP